MNKLLKKVVAAHGGSKRWNELDKLSITIVSGGKLFEVQGRPQDAGPRQMELKLHEQALIMHPFGGPDRKTNFTPERIAIETLNSEVISERQGEVAFHHSHMKAKGWDLLDRAFFNGYANWNYLTMPFFMTMPGITVDDMTPWIEKGETWPGLRITFPEHFATHNPVQDFYFGEDLLLRRHDYYIDVAEDEFYAAQYVFDYQESGGIRLPTKRRAYKRGGDMQPMLDELMVHIDYSDIRFEAFREKTFYNG